MSAPFITREWLLQRTACENQVIIFEAEWPSGSFITRETVQRASDLGLFISWLASETLSPDGLEAYHAAINIEDEKHAEVMERAKAKLKAERAAGKHDAKARFMETFTPIYESICAKLPHIFWSAVQRHGWK